MESRGTLNILQLIATTDPGGAETVVRDLCSVFCEKSVKCSAGVAGGGWLVGELERIGARYYVFSYRPFLDLSFAGKVARYVWKNDIDIIHCHMSQMNILGSVVGAFIRVPALMTFHGITDHFDTKKLICLYRLSFAFSKKLIFVSDSLKRRFNEKVPFSKGKSVVIHNGVNLEKFEVALRERKRRSDGRFVVVAVGNLLPDKDYLTLIDSAFILRKRTEQFIVKIVGEGPERNKIGEYITRLGLSDNVELLGFRREISEILGAADLYVLSSKYEGFSISIVEGMAAGLPVISTRCGGPEEIVDEGRTGYFVEVGDSSRLADYMWGLMNDAGKRRELGSAGRRKALARFSLERMKDKYSELYKSIGFSRKGTRISI